MAWGCRYAGRYPYYKRWDKMHLLHASTCLEVMEVYLIEKLSNHPYFENIDCRDRGGTGRPR